MSSERPDGPDEGSEAGPDEVAARASVDRLRKIGKKLPRPVRAEVLAHGARAIGPLLELVFEATPSSQHGLQLLTELRAPEAIPPLVALLGAADPAGTLVESIGDALGAFGPAVVEPALAELGRSAAQRSAGLLNLLARAGVRDERILQALLDAIERGVPGEAPSIAGQYGDARLGDRVEALLHALEPTDPPSAERVVALGIGLVTFKRFSPAHEKKLEAAYALIRADLQQKIDAIEADPHAPPFDPGAGLFDEGGPLDDVDELDDAVGLDDAGRPGVAADLDEADEGFAPSLGRNDPCWCGSGRKYKRCHAT